MQTYTEQVTINENTDLILMLVKNLQKWELENYPTYVGNNFEVYSNKNKTVEIVLNHNERTIITSYKA